MVRQKLNFEEIKATDVAKREKELAEIEKLFEEQAIDDNNSIWPGRETPISAFNMGDTTSKNDLAKAQDKFLDSIHQTQETAEDLLIKKEEFDQLCKAVSEIGENEFEIFLAICDNASIEEVSQELGLKKKEVADVIRDILIALDSKYQDLFRVVVKQKLAINKPRKKKESVDLDKISKEDEVLYFKEDSGTGNIVLLGGARKLPLDSLRALLKKFGYEASRGTVYKIKKRGYFSPNYHKGEKVYRADVVELTTEEKLMSQKELMDSLGLSRGAARSVKRLGYYRVDALQPGYLNSTKIDPSRVKSVFIKQFKGGRSIILSDSDLSKAG